MRKLQLNPIFRIVGDSSSPRLLPDEIEALMPVMEVYTHVQGHEDIPVQFEPVFWLRMPLGKWVKGQEAA